LESNCSVKHLGKVGSVGRDLMKFSLREEEATVKVKLTRKCLYMTLHTYLFLDSGIYGK
jgi:hypothetical protein